MGKKLAIAIIHGLGSHIDDLDDNQVRLYAKSMIEELKNRVKRNDKDSDQIAWKTIYWTRPNTLDVELRRALICTFFQI